MAQVVQCLELLDKIFSYLPLADLLTASEVCPTWTEVASWKLKRRITLQPGKTCVQSALKISDHETPKHLAVQSAVCSLSGLSWHNCVDADAPDSTESQLEINFPPKLRRNLPLLALQLINADCLSKITRLTFTNWLTVEDWNAAGASILCKFPRLSKLELLLDWIPDYTSSLVPDGAEAAVCPVEHVHIVIRSTGLLVDVEALTPLGGAFLSSCSNLQKLEFTHEQHCTRQQQQGKRKKKKKESTIVTATSSGQFSFHAENNQVHIKCLRETTPVAPFLISLPFNSLFFEDKPEHLNSLNSDVAQKVKSLRVPFPFEAKGEHAVNDLKDILASLKLQRHLSRSLGDLNLGTGMYTNCDYTDKPKPANCGDLAAFQLPNIKRLSLHPEYRLNFEVTEKIVKILVRTLPEVQLLVVPESYKLGVRSLEDIFKMAAAFKRLRHLVFDWPSGSANKDWLEEIRRWLKFQENLESMTICNFPRPGCLDYEFAKLALAELAESAALPRLRQIQVYSYDYNNPDGREDFLQYILAPLFYDNKVTFQIISKMPKWDDFQLSKLDQFCSA